MARIPVLIMVADPATGNAMAGVSATVKDRATGSNVVLYAAETGPTTVANPLTTDAYGRAQAWADRKSFSIAYAGTGLTSWTEYRDVQTSVDGGVSTTEVDGLTYADIASGATGLAVGSFSAYRNAALSLNDAGILICDIEVFDVSGWHDVTTGRFTPQVAGIYRLDWVLQAGIITVDNYWGSGLYKNGAILRGGSQNYQRGGAAGPRTVGTSTVQANGTTDYFDVRLATNNGSTALQAGLIHANAFSGEFVGRA